MSWLSEGFQAPDVGAYRVFRSASANGPWMAAGETTGTTFTDPAPATSTIFYRVAAFDARGLISPRGSAVPVQKAPKK